MARKARPERLCGAQRALDDRVCLLRARVNALGQGRPVRTCRCRAGLAEFRRFSFKCASLFSHAWLAGANLFYALRLGCFADGCAIELHLPEPAVSTSAFSLPSVSAYCANESPRRWQDKNSTASTKANERRGAVQRLRRHANERMGDMASFGVMGE